MYLEELSINNFRNYSEAKLTFSPATNILIGKNAQGKTNLLEAIYVLAMTRSHRTNNDHELLRFKTNSATIRGTLINQLGKTKLGIDLSNKGKKARVNQLEQAKLSQYIGKMNVILFAPEDLSLVKGSPAVRRRFIDMEFGQIDANYLYNLSQYKAVLKQRNRYLKQLQQKKVTDLLLLDVFSDQLAAFGAEIIIRRLGFLTKLGKFAAKLQLQITNQQESLKLRYDSTINLEDQKMIKTDWIYKKLKEQYRQQQKKEIFQGTTLSGPHRDDLAFLINEKNVQLYGSQGQQRTAALSVKLAEVDLMHQETGEYPILLLDDVLSELDGARQTSLIKSIQNRVQTFLTTPSLNDVARQLIKDPKVFIINQGKISEPVPKEENKE
ncbi:MAG: DNA replication/repair protein RecF [Liquorilactobacillus nagelii]|jgi:DNA replication and repair protein RecF|uniref:DNA replication and repair protein RecF n=1 Tax=Liquorilactobacillus nagelii TaxID=82688 RepID=A0A3S6QY12_9LACO|nr:MULTISPECIES: DNA replication/repair protein RecF [Lactobacillales]AUJ31095.1 DNA replication/repair protein RecF [Liquorilactobacillus nagelii]KRL42270.1 recombination protein F [Liquorilactobacillus nagelii DSM 13675]MCC7616505.1 DNA replication and repair protein RecF [Liquorilactobacillus nagelii]MCI1699003.1 DNA replication/repair protein RecF [Liquorilactobacillus nagelii]MCI1819965.1 DNA replication/repair protein RecF [Carnobacterium maltaromaticum]